MRSRSLVGWAGVRYSEIDAPSKSLCRLVKRLAVEHERWHICHLPGLTGDGLYRCITDRGYPQYDCRAQVNPLEVRRPGQDERRDALARFELLRACELRAVWVPDRGGAGLRAGHHRAGA